MCWSQVEWKRVMRVMNSCITSSQASADTASANHEFKGWTLLFSSRVGSVFMHGGRCLACMLHENYVRSSQQLSLDMTHHDNYIYVYIHNIYIYPISLTVRGHISPLPKNTSTVACWAASELQEGPRSAKITRSKSSNVV